MQQCTCHRSSCSAQDAISFHHRSKSHILQIYYAPIDTSHRHATLLLGSQCTSSRKGGGQGPPCGSPSALNYTRTHNINKTKTEKSGQVRSPCKPQAQKLAASAPMCQQTAQTACEARRPDSKTTPRQPSERQPTLLHGHLSQSQLARKLTIS